MQSYLFYSKMKSVNRQFYFIFWLFQNYCPHFPPITLPCPTHPHLPNSVLPPSCCLCAWVLRTCSLTTLPLLLPISPSPCPSGHCQFVLYFNVSGSILLACLFYWLGVWENTSVSHVCKEISFTEILPTKVKFNLLSSYKDIPKTYFILGLSSLWFLRM